MNTPIKLHTTIWYRFRPVKLSKRGNKDQSSARRIHRYENCQIEAMYFNHTAYMSFRYDK